MTYFQIVSVTMGLIMFIFGLLIMIRSFWVMRVRTRMLMEDIFQYEAMPSFDAMMRRYWVWSAKGFGWKSR